MGMDILFSACAFVIGLVLGSFFNVLIYRLPRNESIISPGSHCPRCNHAIRPWENVPLVSFILLRGKCSACEHPISFQYPLVELLTACAALAIGRLVVSPQLAAEPSFWHAGVLALQSLVLLLLIPLSIIDIKHYIIPDMLTIPGLVAAIIVSFFPGGLTPVQSIVGMLAGGGTLFAIGAIGTYMLNKKDTMGGGDIRLMALIGALWGWKIAIGSIVLASFLGSLIGLMLLAFHVLAKDHKLPFGPFLAIGAWASVLSFDKLLGLYLSWLG
jgi:leader peptidase (prepilin peptidase)/N-methyltransferase